MRARLLGVSSLGVSSLVPGMLLAWMSGVRQAFSLGALVPLLPYLLGFSRLAASLVVTAVALTAGGMTVGRLTGRPLLRSGLRQLLLGAVAIAVTFLVGSLIGGHGA